MSFVATSMIAIDNVVYVLELCLVTSNLELVIPWVGSNIYSPKKPL